MAKRFTKKLREEILNEYFEKSGASSFVADAFVRWVKRRGPSHPAYSWFEWADEKAGARYREWQAREFVRDLRIVVEEAVIRGSVVTVREHAPTFLSPVSGRQRGGGYNVFNPRDPEHIREICEQAHADLSAWAERYGLAMKEAGISQKTISAMLSKLEAVS